LYTHTIYELVIILDALIKSNKKEIILKIQIDKKIILEISPEALLFHFL
jgi:hypothetical protein